MERQFVIDESDFETLTLRPNLVLNGAMQRRASREAPLPGAANTGGMGSMSPRQQGIEIMKANPRWRQDPEMSKRVNDLYAQEAAGIKRRG